MEKIVSNIEAIRKEMGLNQDVLSERLGISQGSYSTYLTKNKDIKYGTISKIADKLGISVVDIITYPDKYVLEGSSCRGCKEKDEIIRNLNSYIEVLEGKLERSARRKGK